MILIFLIILIVIIICVNLRSKSGSAEKKDLSTEIMGQLSQYKDFRVKKYLELNNIDEIIEKENISSVKEFFDKEGISEEKFLTGTQKEVLFQSGKKKLTQSALEMTDQELIQAFQEGESIFIS
jgi:hypothetical protein